MLRMCNCNLWHRHLWKTFSSTSRTLHYLSSRSSKLTSNGIYKLLPQQHEQTFQLDEQAKLPYLEIWNVLNSKDHKFPVEFQSPRKFFVPGDNIDDHDRIIQRLYQNRKPNSILLYVHGFHDSPDLIWKNANFLHQTIVENDAAEKGKQKIEDIIVYDWPTTFPNRHVEKMDPFLAYAHDAEMAMSSVRRLNRLLYVLLDSGITVHLLGHNMGARIVVNSIQSLTHDYAVVSRNQSHGTATKETHRLYTERLHRIGEVILKQPDINVTTMVAFINKAMRRMNSLKSEEKRSLLHIFIHDSDHRLELAEYIHNRNPRVGQNNGKQLLIETLQKNTSQNLGIEFIDMSKIIDQGKSWNKLSCCDETYNANPSFESIVTESHHQIGNHTYFDDENFQFYLKKILESKNVLTNEASEHIAL